MFVPGEVRDTEDIRNMEFAEKGKERKKTGGTTHIEGNQLPESQKKMIQPTVGLLGGRTTIQDVNGTNKDDTDENGMLKIQTIRPKRLKE